MNLVFFILTNIFCAVQFDTMQCNFYIVTDRKMRGLVKKDGTQTDMLLPVDNPDGLSFDYMWNEYFPKPIMYEFNCKKIMNSKKSVNLKLKGITDNDEVLFGFTLRYTNQILKLLNFVDSNDIPITHALYTNDKNYNNIIILSSKSKFVTNLKASFNYFLYMNKLTPFYEEILKNLFRYVKNINELVQNVKEDKIFDSASAAKDYIVFKTIGILISLSSIKVPNIKSLSKLSSAEMFGIEMNILFRFFEDVVEIYLKNKNKGTEEAILFDKTEIYDNIKNIIIQDDSLTKCVNAYKNLYRGLKHAEGFVHELRRLKITCTASDITSDCDVEKIDEFLAAYSFILLDYYKIIKSINYYDVFNYFFTYEPLEFDSCIEKIESFFIDKLIAKRICSFIHEYEKDKTNFLIFSQTDVFKQTLSFRILSNLKIAKAIYSNRNTLEISSEDKSHIKLDDICNLEKIWKIILKNVFKKEIKSFNDLLAQEKLPMPFYTSNIFLKREFIEFMKQKNKPDNLSECNHNETKSGLSSESDSDLREAVYEPNSISYSDLSGAENEQNNLLDSDLSETEHQLNEFKNVKRRLNTTQNEQNDLDIIASVYSEPFISIEKGRLFIIMSLGLFFLLVLGFKRLLL